MRHAVLSVFGLPYLAECFLELLMLSQRAECPFLSLNGILLYVHITLTLCLNYLSIFKMFLFFYVFIFLLIFEIYFKYSRNPFFITTYNIVPQFVYPQSTCLFLMPITHFITLVL